MIKTKKITNLQQELLKLFGIDLNERQLMEIKGLLYGNFAKKKVLLLF